MSTPDIKSRPQRIELDYFRRPDPYTRLRWRLVCLALLLVGCYVLYATIWGTAAHVNTGPLSMAHAHLERDCGTCHSQSWPVSLASDALRIAPERSLEHMESTCQSCHPVANHFRASLNEEHQSIDRNCTGCHQEHLGQDHQLTWVSDNMCVNCHQDLPSSMATASSSLRPNIQAFSLESHGEFRSLAKDTGRIRFNHSQHLRPGQVAPNTRGAIRLDMLPARWQGMYQKPGQAPEETVVLDCADCHQLPGQTEGGPATADAEVTTAHFLPIRYSRHCAGCHALNYAEQSQDVLPLPHAAPWAELKRILAAKLVGNKLLAPSDDVRATNDATLGPRPDQATIESDEVDSQLTRSLQFVRQQCLTCHLPDDISNQAIERLISLDSSELIPTRWFKHGSFDHAAHRQWDCQLCHHVADSDPKSQPDNQTVMIDGIGSCTTCHRAATSAPTSPGGIDTARMEGQVSRASDRCVLCHRYHWTRPNSASQVGPSEE